MVFFTNGSSIVGIGIKPMAFGRTIPTK